MNRTEFDQQISAAAATVFPGVTFLQAHALAKCRVESWLSKSSRFYDEGAKEISSLAVHYNNPIGWKWIVDGKDQREGLRPTPPLEGAFETATYTHFQSFAQALTRLHYAWFESSHYTVARAMLFDPLDNICVPDMQVAAIEAFETVWSPSPGHAERVQDQYRKILDDTYA